MNRLDARATTVRIVAIIAVLAPLQARASDSKAPQSNAVMGAVYDCRKLTDNVARLKCYDDAVGVLNQAETQGRVVVVDHDEVAAVRRKAFGFSLPSMTLFNKAFKEEPVERVAVELSSAYLTAGKWSMVTTDDAAWRQTDDTELAPQPHKGSKMVIRAGLLGSFFCAVDGQTAVRCKRER